MNQDSELKAGGMFAAAHLLACPFCGEQPSYEPGAQGYSPEFHWHHQVVHNCIVLGQQICVRSSSAGLPDTKESVYSLWNTRATWQANGDIIQPGGETEFLLRTGPQVQGRVLVMDDDLLIGEMVSELLKTIGVDVVSTCDGLEALQCLQTAKYAGRPFDLVILDLVVPRGMGGKETIRQIRQLDADVKAIVSSGDLGSPAVARWRDFGFDASLPKPYRASSLLRLVFELLPRRTG